MKNKLVSFQYPDGNVEYFIRINYSRPQHEVSLRIFKDAFLGCIISRDLELTNCMKANNIVIKEYEIPCL